jgi:hypothetical protein
MATVVSIGRNVSPDRVSVQHFPNGELGFTDWADFRQEVGCAVADACGTVYFVGTGYSPSLGEDSTTWVAADLPSNGRVESALYWKLGALAEKYKQDSIAVTTGVTQLVSCERGMVVVEPA